MPIEVSINPKVKEGKNIKKKDDKDYARTSFDGLDLDSIKVEIECVAQNPQNLEKTRR